MIERSCNPYYEIAKIKNMAASDMYGEHFTCNEKAYNNASNAFNAI